MPRKDFDLQRRILRHVSDIQEQSILDSSPSKALGVVLQALLDLTESAFGFVGEVLRDPQGKPFLRGYAVTNIGWTEELRQKYETSIGEGMDFRNLDTLFGQVLLSGESLITNSPATHPSAGGVPPGHPELHSFAGIPVYSGEEYVGICGLANRPQGYTDEWLELLAPVVSAAGLILSGLRLSRDRNISRRREAYRQAVQQTMIQASIDPFMMTDSHGRIIEFNPAAARVFGLEREQAMNLPLTHLIAKEDRAAFRERLLDPAAPASGTMKVWGLSKEGAELPIEVRTAKLQDEPGTRAFFVRDLTVEQAAKRALSRAHALREAEDQRKLSFIAVVSHELRTPLTTLSSSLDLLSATKVGESERELLNAALGACDTVLDLVESLLDFSRMDAMEMELRPSPLSLALLASSLFDQYRPMAVKKGIELCRLEADTDNAESDLLFGDVVRLRQILGNLIANAIKFTDAGHVGFGFQVVAEPGTGKFTVTWHVEDTGRGISDEFRPNLFQPFSQADSSLSRSKGGSGLGLVISQRLAVLMGGTLHLVRSSPKGSRFELTLSLASALTGATNAQQSMQRVSLAMTSAAIDHGEHPVKVLLVDDNAANLALLSRQVAAMHYDVDVASSGKRALAVLALKQFDLVLLDLEMPEINGLEVARQHRMREAAENSKRTVIIALTGHVAEEFREDALAAGCDGFLTKPFRITSLISALQSFGVFAPN